MRNILIFIFAFFLFTSCGKSQDICIDNWSTIIYNYSSGPLPPPYHYSYTISINKDGTSNMIYRLGYDKDTEPLTFNFILSQEVLDKLGQKIYDSKILTGEIKALPENAHPVGGSLQNAKILIVNPDPDLDQPPKVFESPYFPEKIYEADLASLYEYINFIIPEDVNMTIAYKKSKFEQEFNKDVK